MMCHLPPFLARFQEVDSHQGYRDTRGCSLVTTQPPCLCTYVKQHSTALPRPH